MIVVFNGNGLKKDNWMDRLACMSDCLLGRQQQAMMIDWPHKNCSFFLISYLKLELDIRIFDANAVVPPILQTL